MRAPNSLEGFCLESGQLNHLASGAANPIASQAVHAIDFESSAGLSNFSSDDAEASEPLEANLACGHWKRVVYVR